MTEKQVKDYLYKYNLKSKEDLAQHIVELKRNTNPNTRLISELVYVLEDEESVFNSFLAENKRIKNIYKDAKELRDTFAELLQNPNSANDIYRELKQCSGQCFCDGSCKKLQKTLNNHVSKAINTPFFLDEVLEQKSNSTRHKSRYGETHTELPNFNNCISVVPLKRGKTITYKSKEEGFNPSDHYLADEVGHFKQFGKKEKEGKLHYELSWEFIEEMAKRMANNKSDKYPLYNWKQKINVQDLKDAINRHHIEVMKGNYKDGDEILGHIVQYACNSMMLWEQLRSKT